MNEHIEHVNGTQLEDLIKTSKMPVIVDYFSDECPPCEVLAPIFEKMAEKYWAYIKFVKIMRQENRETALSMWMQG